MLLETDRKVVSVRRYPTYEVRTEIVDDSEYGGDGQLEMKSACNPNGDYIGDPKTAKFLADKGIIPQTIDDEHKVCSIGYSPEDKKWYGWSHRAIYGFKPGTKITKNSTIASDFKPGHICKDTEEAKEMAIAFANSVA